MDCLVGAAGAVFPAKERVAAEFAAEIGERAWGREGGEELAHVNYTVYRFMHVLTSTKFCRMMAEQRFYKLFCNGPVAV